MNCIFILIYVITPSVVLLANPHIVICTLCAIYVCFSCSLLESLISLKINSDFIPCQVSKAVMYLNLKILRWDFP